RRTNVEGTRNLLEAAASRGLRRAVHVSSVAVYGGAEAIGRGPIDEDFPRDRPLPPGEAYARSKRESEEV
ncbi:MAG: NAD-dependent epimerase/dehydratase family protein, partial [Gemmatimonadetes bacterium]|nr:NAD-dependent epimerase/dehydratase family protein [Gemmatimonadota bacterium]